MSLKYKFLFINIRKTCFSLLHNYDNNYIVKIRRTGVLEEIINYVLHVRYEHANNHHSQGGKASRIKGCIHKLTIGMLIRMVNPNLCGAHPSAHYNSPTRYVLGLMCTLERISNERINPQWQWLPFKLYARTPVCETVRRMLCHDGISTPHAHQIVIACARAHTHTYNPAINTPIARLLLYVITHVLV